MRRHGGFVSLLLTAFLLQAGPAWSGDVSDCLKVAHEDITSENIPFKTDQVYQATPAWEMGDFRRAPLKDSDRKKLIFTVKNGQLVDRFGKELPIPEEGKIGEFIYTMDAAGNKFGSDKGIHHNNIMAEAPAGAAGNLRWLISANEDKTRRFLIVSDKSGHYLPEPWFTRQMVLELEREGFDLDNVLVELDALSGLPKPRAAEILPWISKNDPKMTQYLNHVIEDTKSSAEAKSIAATRLLMTTNDPQPVFKLIQAVGPDGVMSSLTSLGYMARLEILEPIATFLAQNRTRFGSESMRKIDEFLYYVNRKGVIERTGGLSSSNQVKVQDLDRFLKHKDPNVRALTIERIKQLKISDEWRDETLTELRKILPTLDQKSQEALQTFITEEAARGDARKIALSLQKGDDTKLAELTELLRKNDTVTSQKTFEAIEQLLDDSPHYSKVVTHIESQLTQLPAPVRLEAEKFLNKTETKKIEPLLSSFKILSEIDRKKFVLGKILDHVSDPNPRTGKVTLQSLHDMKLPPELETHVRDLLKKKQGTLSPEVQQEADKLF